MEALLLDRSDSNAPNQARTLFDQIISEKKKTLMTVHDSEVLNNFTIESPVPYSIENVLNYLKAKDVEMVPGVKTGTEKQGPLNGKLTRFIQRLESKRGDKRLNFIFSSESELMDYNWFEKLIGKLLNFGDNKGLKIIDFSEVPSSCCIVLR